ncbi:MAG: carboxylesterase family protein [Deltaproteobacteria bacterium]|nr:carboxylesterase family protein [Deltaproteobacteria bacterium]
MRIAGIVAVGSLLAAAAGLWLWSMRPIPDRTERVVIADVASERLLRTGSVVGFAGPNDTHAWLGIPYAKAPIGELRWRAPQRPEPWTETLDALAYGSPCVQLASPLGGVADEPPGTLTGSEDCLRLNLWAPRFDPSTVPKGGDRLPVMLWIHGGGNTIGHAGAQYEGSMLASSHRLMVVTFNYRLGPFGWFAHPALLRATPRGETRSGNFGTLDIIAAMRWVHENIEYFGGDPDNVTIFGESAGGTNVVSMLVSPLARDLFHRAIVQSGSTASSSEAHAMSFVDDETKGHAFSSQEILLRHLIRDGTASDRESARVFAEGLDPSDIVEYLRAKTPAEVVEAYRIDEDEARIHLPLLIRDGVVLPKEPASESLGAGNRHNRVPVILGTNRDEIKLFFSQSPEFVSRYLKIFVRLHDRKRYDTLAGFHSDMWKVNGVDGPAASLRASQEQNVYAYRFDWDEEPVFLGADLSVILGASHGLEIPFVFGLFRFGEARLERLIFNADNWPGRKYVSDAMMSYWAEFAYTGSPGQGRAHALPEWAPWPEADAGRFMVFDTPAGGGIRMQDGRITRADVIAAVDAETSLAQPERCRVFWNLFRHSEDWSEEEWRDMGAGGCRDVSIQEMIGD